MDTWVSVAPRPFAAPAVDRAAKTIDSCVLIVGSEAERQMDAAHARTARVPSERGINYAQPGEPSFRYFAMKWGPIRGFVPTFHFYGISDDPRLAAMAEGVARSVAAVIVAHTGPQLDTVRAAARAAAAAKRPIATAVLGGDALALEWTRTTGAAPGFAAPAVSEEHFTSALKSVGKAILSSL